MQADQPLVFFHRSALELIEELEKALEFYANFSSYTPEGVVFDHPTGNHFNQNPEPVQDFGTRANEALAQLQAWRDGK